MQRRDVHGHLRGGIRVKGIKNANGGPGGPTLKVRRYTEMPAITGRFVVGVPTVWASMRTEKRTTCPWCGMSVAMVVNPHTGEDMPLELDGNNRARTLKGGNGEVMGVGHIGSCPAVEVWKARRLAGREHSWGRK